MRPGGGYYTKSEWDTSELGQPIKLAVSTTGIGSIGIGTDCYRLQGRSGG